MAVVVNPNGPQTSPASLTVPENAAATAIGIVAPVDADDAASALSVSVLGLPTDGTVTLADGVTAVTVGQSLTVAQLTGLEFAPTPGAVALSEQLVYSVSNPAGISNSEIANLAIAPAQGSTVLTVGPGKEYATIAAAIAASHNGDTIQVQAGTYTNDIATINDDITLEGVGGMVNMVAMGTALADGNDKGILVTNGNDTINNFSFSGAQADPSSDNGAGIRYQAGALVLNDDYFFNNQDGLLGAANATGTITINNTEFADNGVSDPNAAGYGFTHNLYVGAIATLTIDNSYFTAANIGHEIKSRALNTIIENSRIDDGPTGTASYSIDLPNGGNALIENNVIEQGPLSQNPIIITIGEEGAVNPTSSLQITGNTILNDLASVSSLAVKNTTSTTAQITGNAFFGLKSTQIATGPNTQSNNVFLTGEPTLDTTAPYESQTSSGAVVGGGQGLTVSAGQTSNGVIILSGGDEFVESGGAANDTVAEGGTVVVYGSARGSVLNSGSYLYLEGGLAIGTEVNSGVAVIYGIASNTIDDSGGFDFVLSGGTAIGTVLSGGEEYVELGATASGTVVDGGAQVVYGTVLGTVLNSGTSAYLEPGSIASGVTVDGALAVIYGAVGATTVEGGGFDYVEPGGTISGTVLSGGDEYVESGAAANGTVINSGAEVVYGTTTGTEINGGSFEYVYPGGTASGTIVNSGIESIFDLAVGTVVNSGGEDFVNDGAASGTIVAGGDELVEFATSAVGTLVSGAGGAQFVYGTALDTTLVSGGEQVVEAGGGAGATAVNSGGYEYVASGGTAAGATIAGGTVELTSGALTTTAIAFAVSGGGQLRLDDSQAFAGTIAGFGIPDQIDLEGIAFGSNTALGFQEAASNMSGTLAIGDGILTANLTLLGQYVAGQFLLASDGNGGTLVTDPPISTTNELPTAYAGALTRT